MSMFLPEGFSESEQKGTAAVTPGNQETTASDIALMQRVLSAASRNPNLIPADFMAYLFDYLQTQRLMIPIGQVFGFSGYAARNAQATTFDNGVTTTTFSDFTTDGPVLPSLPSGRYVILVACDIQSIASGRGRMGYSVNGSPPDAVKSCTCQASGGFISTAQIAIETFTDPANTLTAQRKIDVAVGSADFGYRSILALRFGNL